jgi:CopG family nickel-responsive transcriptional regulator
LPRVRGGPFLRMATIVSLSLTPEILSEMDSAQSRLGFGSRSELIRASVSSLLAESQEVGQLQGEVSAILTVVHAHGAEGDVSRVKHEFEDVITTQIHNSFHGECVELFLLHGQAGRIKELYKELRTSKKIKYVKFVVNQGVK